MKKRKNRKSESPPPSAAAGPVVWEASPEDQPPATDSPSDGTPPIPVEDDATTRTNFGGVNLTPGPDDAELAASETTTQDPIESADFAPYLEAESLADGDATIPHATSADSDFSADAAVEHEAAQEAEASDVADGEEPLPEVEGSRLESIIESLLFAADRPLVINELKRMLGERDGKRITEALHNLQARHQDSGIQVMSVAGGWQLRTHPGNGAWVAKLVAGRPTRLSRAMMETLAIVAYRQPITRPEIDEIRGVDCGPVLRTLLDRALIRVIGKKEEVGRPMLYGTTPEFLKIFSLRDLADLPTLREFHELGADDRAKVDATAGPAPGMVAGDAFGAAPGGPPADVARGELPDVDPEEEDSLLEALEQAAHAAGQATRAVTDPTSTDDDAEGAAVSATSSDAGDR